MMKKVTLPFTKAFILDHQLLRLNNETSSVSQVIDQIGYVQIDTISVVQRAHHHVLWSRLPNYQLADLQQTQAEGSIFDYWAHAASYLPMKDYRFSLYRKAQIAAGKGHWHYKNPKIMKKVLKRLQKDGPLMARDFEKGSFEKTHAWGSHPINQALRQLFMEGQIMISERIGFQKKYDLPERILANHVNTQMPSRSEYLQYVIRRDVKAHGIIKTRDLGHLLKGTKKDIQKEAQKMLQSGELCEVQIKSKGKDIYLAFTEKIDLFTAARPSSKLQILSPFDNVLILRKRLLEIFDFDYVLECYVTAAKRKVGYFSLPLLYKNNFVGQIDLKADRKKQILWINNLVWEKDLKNKKSTVLALKKSINQFADFNNCTDIQVIKERRKEIQLGF